MEARSAKRSESERLFTRGRMVVGVVLLVGLGVLAVIAFALVGRGSVLGSLVYIGSDGIVVRDLSSGEEETVADWPSRAADPLADRDRPRLAYTLGDDLVFVDLGSGEAETWSEDGYRPAAWRDGRLTAVRGGEIAFLSADGEAEELYSQEGVTAEPPVVWLDEERFAVEFVAEDGESSSLTIVTTQPPAGGNAVTASVPNARPLAASEDGAQLLLAQTREDTERLGVLDTVEVRTSDVKLQGTGFVAATSPEGVVVFSGNAGEVTGEPGAEEVGDPEEWIWSLEPEARASRIEGVRATAITWTRDGSSIVYVTEGGAASIRLPGGEPSPIRISPEDRDFLAVVP